MSFRHLSILFWIAIFLAAAEIVLEARAARRGWGTLLFSSETPDGKGAGSEREYGPTADFPFRSPIVASERSAGVSRIWIASSSYAQDKRLPANAIFPTLLGRALTRDGQPAQVLNASQNGHAIKNNVRELGELGDRWQPDVVLLYQMSNDVDLLSQEHYGAASTPAPEDSDEQLLDAPEGPDSSQGSTRGALVRVVEETTLYHNIKSNLTARLAAGRQLVDRVDPRLEVLFERELRSFVQAVRTLGAQPVLCTFASSHASHDQERATVTERTLLRFNLHLSLEAWIDAVARLNEVIRRVARDEQIALVDVARELTGQVQHFRDFSHLRETGHQEVARILARELKVVLATDD